MTERAREDADHAAWVLARESGQPGPTVSDATAARYARLQALIADLPDTEAGVAPRPGWQHDVFAALDAADAEPLIARDPPPVGSGDATQVTARSAGGAVGIPPLRDPASPIDPAMSARTRQRPRRWAVATLVFAAVVVAAISVYHYGGERSDGPGPEPTLAFEIEPAVRPHRSSEPSVGDQLIIRAEVAAAGELRVYDAAGLEAARCTVPAPACTVERSGRRATLRLTMPLRAPGTLRAVLFAAPVAAPSGRMDLDVEAAAHAGIGVIMREQEVH
jgi:hypothetical protein